MVEDDRLRRFALVCTWSIQAPGDLSQRHQVYRNDDKDVQEQIIRKSAARAGNSLQGRIDTPTHSDIRLGFVYERAPHIMLKTIANNAEIDVIWENQRALARSARRIPIGHPDLEKVAGDALDPSIVKRALDGADAVIETIGVTPGLEAILKPVRLRRAIRRASSLATEGLALPARPRLW